MKYNSTLYDSLCIVFGNKPEFVRPSNFKSRRAFYASEHDFNPSIEDHMMQLLTSLVWSLEDERLTKTNEKVKCHTILCIIYISAKNNMFMCVCVCVYFLKNNLVKRTDSAFNIPN